MPRTSTIYYETLGNPANPCIILIAGIGGQLIDWPKALTQGLVDKGFYVITFDNRDSGLSNYYDELGVPNLPEAITSIQQGKAFAPPYTLEDMASDVIHLMDELSIKKAHIVGGSMGGIIAQYVALNFIDRVLSLTCIATTSGDPNLPKAKQEVLDFFAKSMTGKTQDLENAINNKLQLFKIYYHPDSFDEEKIRNQILTSFKRAHHPDGFKRQLLAMIITPPRTEKLKNLKLPTLIIHGDFDPVFPIEHGKQLTGIIADSHLEVIHKMGHGIPDFSCEKIVELIASYFLANKNGKRSVF